MSEQECENICSGKLHHQCLSLIILELVLSGGLFHVGFMPVIFWNGQIGRSIGGIKASISVFKMKQLRMQMQSMWRGQKLKVVLDHS